MISNFYIARRVYVPTTLYVAQLSMYWRGPCLSPIFPSGQTYMASYSWPSKTNPIICHATTPWSLQLQVVVPSWYLSFCTRQREHLISKRDKNLSYLKGQNCKQRQSWQRKGKWKASHWAELTLVSLVSTVWLRARDLSWFHRPQMSWLVSVFGRRWTSLRELSSVELKSSAQKELV